jgi:hypothetical protein
MLHVIEEYYLFPSMAQRFGKSPLHAPMGLAETFC